MRIAICDDEKDIREILAEKVNKYCPEAEIFCYASGQEVLTADRMPDILFLDIQMPGASGMETAQGLRARSKELILIFVTALEEYVFQAFDVGAFHYLVKPFEEEKFVCVLSRAVKQCREASENAGVSMAKEEDRHILILSGGSHIKIRLCDIVYAEVFNRKVVIHKMTEDMEYYGKMSDLEKLAGKDFFRPHRSYLVNFQYVVRYDAQMIELESGNVPGGTVSKVKVPLAKKNYPLFVKSYLNYNRRTEGDGNL